MKCYDLHANAIRWAYYKDLLHSIYLFFSNAIANNRKYVLQDNNLFAISDTVTNGSLYIWNSNTEHNSSDFRRPMLENNANSELICNHPLKDCNFILHMNWKTFAKSIRNLMKK